MAVVTKLVSEIIETVNNSKLDYKMNQTPYSLHFSIRKKFTKNSIHSSENDDCTLKRNDEVLSQNNYLRQELLKTMSEYQKLFEFYQFEMDAKIRLESELSRACQNVENLVDIEKEANKLKTENTKLQINFENKCLELKQSKAEIGELKKDKNELSVALKGSKKEVKENLKSFEKKEDVLEKKIKDLIEYKNRKVVEERVEKLKKRKELKKANKKLNNDVTKTLNEVEETSRTEINSNNTMEGDTETSEKDINSNSETVDEDKKYEKEPENVKMEDLGKDSESEKPEVKLACVGGEVLDENDKAFIGPRLPRRMTKEEIEEFRKELLGKYFPT